MVSSWQNGDWIETVQSRLTDSASPQSERSSNATAVQEPDTRPLEGRRPSPPVFPQTHTSLPTSPLGQTTSQKDTRTLTDPNTHDHFVLFPPATLAEQASLPKLPASSTTISASDLSSRHPAQLALHKPISLDTSSQPSPSDHFAQTIWDSDPVKPGTVLFSTGPHMSKPPSGQPPGADSARRSSVDRPLWGVPSTVPSANPSSDSTPTQGRDVAHPPGYQSDAPSLVYTTGHPTNTGSHTGYTVGYPSYPGSAPFGPSSPRHPSFGGQPNASPHVQGGTYPNTGSGPVYTNYRPGMPYSPYAPYQSGSGFSQYPTSPPAFGPIPANYSGGYSAASPAASGYPTSPSASNYQGSSVGGNYSSPTGAYGMHFPPYGMVSAPPMYAPAIYAHAPYGHPYLPPQGHAEDGSTPGMWWFMPTGAGSGANTTQPAGAFNAQPQQPQFLQQFGSSQQPLQQMSAMLNTSSSHPPQFPAQIGFPPPPAARSPAASLSPVATGPTRSTASPHQMYAAFGAMNLQSPQPPVGRQPPPLMLPTHAYPAPPSATASQSARIQSPVRPTSTSKGRASAASKAGPGGSRVTSPVTRKPWHPNPPVARSDWVMWVGNVPSDATHDELWTFFNQDTTAREPVAPTGPGRTLLPPPAASDKDTGAADGNPQPLHGVSSVFLISRSNCAFVNYEEEEYLSRAVSFFNGRPLRPQDPRCPRLVCRVRRKDDDLRAGVGGQRGMGMHTRWVQDQERRVGETIGGLDTGKDGAVDEPATSPSTYLGATSSSGSSPGIPAPVDDTHKLPADLLGRPDGGDPREHSGPHHSGSGSTNSSFLIRNFPKRYFILKSLTQHDLDISVQRDLWATQAHNESTLDRAFRTSKDVYLIFSANKSGEWFGYARMEGPITNSQQSVSWESRGPSKSPTSPTVQRKSEAAGAALDGEGGKLGSKMPFFSPSEHKFAASPVPITPSSTFPTTTRVDGQASAPPEMDQAHKQLTGLRDGIESQGKATVPAAIISQQNSFKLDQSAPYRAARAPGAFPKEQDGHIDGDGVIHRDTADELEQARGLSEDPSVRPIRETFPSVDGEEDDKAESWGKPFKIKWIKTEKLPFHRTRHLRNPWNSDREVKVSRDGTEVEPSVGQRLLDEWDRVVETPEPTTASGPTPPSRNVSIRPAMQQSAYGSAPPTGRGQPGRTR